LDPYGYKPNQASEYKKTISGASFSAFEQALITFNESSLEKFLGTDFMNLRGVIIERASFAQIQDSDLEDMFLLNPSCYWLVHISAEDPLGQQAVFNKLAKAKAVGYGIWQLPDFRVFDMENMTLPVFGKWILLATSDLV
jgi:hypothetical protein